MKTVLFQGSFDPITIQDIERIKEYHRLGYEVYIEQMTNTKRAKDILKHSLRQYHYVNYHCLDKYDEIRKVEDVKIDLNIFGKLTHSALRLAFNRCYYYEEVIKLVMSNKRYVHSLSVAKCCRGLAKIHHLDSHVCYMMGLVHDITKELDTDQEEDIMKKYYYDKIDEPRALYHQYTGAYYIKKYLRINDKRIINACLNHTSAKAYDQYSMVLYIADKIEPTRSYDVERLQASAKRNLKQGFEEVRLETLKYIKKEK